MPCSPGDYGAQEKSWMSIDPLQLAEPDVDMVGRFGRETWAGSSSYSLTHVGGG